MNQIKGFQMILKWDKLTSVNRMYIRTKTGMTLSPECRKFKREVAKQVRLQLPKSLPFNNKDVFKLSLQFVLKERFFVRDTSNFIKLVEDTIFDELDINDARNLELECKKCYNPKSPYEYVFVTVEKSDFDYTYLSREDDSDDIEEEEEKLYTIDEVEKLLTSYAVELLNSSLSKDLDDITKNTALNELPQFLRKPEDGKSF